MSECSQQSLILKDERYIINYESEIYYRNAVSRAYYSIYHHIHEHFPPIPNFNNTGTHEALELHLKNLILSANNSNKLKTLLYIFSAQKRLRIQADYKLKEKMTQQEAFMAIEQAEKFMQITAEIT